MSRDTKIRVLLAEDHVMVRDGLKRLIDEQRDMEVVAEAADGAEALHLSQSHKPDIALVDISMPGWDGVMTAQQIAAACPKVRIIAVTRHGDDVSVNRMMSAGASGYVLKQRPSRELVNAVRTVADGGQYVDASLRMPAAPAPAKPAAAKKESAPLTFREETVLRSVASFWSNQRIAESLGIGSEDVATVKTVAMQKAGLQTRMQVVHYARERGWIEQE